MKRKTTESREFKSVMDREATSDVYGMLNHLALRLRPDLADIEDPEVLQKEIDAMLCMRRDGKSLLQKMLGCDPLGIRDILDQLVKDSVKDEKNIKSLPVEDTIWLFETETAYMDEDGDLLRYIKIVDQKNQAIGIVWGSPSEESMASICLKAVRVSCLHPWWGVPRRPRSITFKNPNFVKEAGELDLSHLGINYMYQGQSKMMETDHTRMRECFMCQLRGSRQLFKQCMTCNFSKRCQAVLYCSKKCQKKDWFPSEDGQGHKFWCSHMKQYMTQADKLSALPFSFVKETCGNDWDLAAYKRFLEGQGVYNQGAWKHELHLPASQTRRKSAFGQLPIDDDVYVLPVESSILEDPLNGGSGLNGLLHDWEAYYRERGFRLDSPIAILLQWPLTAYYILNYCVPNDVPSWWDDLNDGSLSVDIVGVEQEVEMLPVFQELGVLMPNVDIDILMCGLSISKKMHNKVFNFGNVTIVVKQGMYQNLPESIRKPDVVIGFNAGLAAYSTWRQTVLKLRTQKIPAYFTDYSRYSCKLSHRCVERYDFGTTSEPVINPFRSPVRHLADENEMPQYSNGFLFRLIYPS